MSTTLPVRCGLILLLASCATGCGGCTDDDGSLGTAQGATVGDGGAMTTVQPAAPGVQFSKTLHPFPNLEAGR